MSTDGKIETDAIKLRQTEWTEEDLMHIEDALHSLHADGKITAMPGLEHVRNMVAVRIGMDTKPEGSFANND